MKKLIGILLFVCALHSSEIAYSQNNSRPSNEVNSEAGTSTSTSSSSTINVGKVVNGEYHTWTLNKIELTPSHTVCYWSVTPLVRDTHIWMTKNVYLIDNNGNKYPMLSCEGLSIEPKKDYIYNIRTVNFTVTFPAIDPSATSLTYFSSEKFKIKDIKIKDGYAYDENAFENALIKLMLLNMEKPAFRANMESLAEGFKQMHWASPIEGENEYIRRKGITRNEFVELCIDKYINERLPYTYAILLSSLMEGPVSAKDVETVLEYMEDPELFNATIRLEDVSESVEMLDDDFWDDAANKLMSGQMPKVIQEKYCSDNYKALFDDYYTVSQTDQMIQAMIDGMLSTAEYETAPEVLEIFRLFKEYLLVTCRTVCLNYCIEKAITERELQICVNFYSTNEYQTLTQSMIAAMQAMYSDPETIGQFFWNDYSEWVKNNFINNAL